MLQVDDPMGHAAGSYAVETGAGRAKVARTDEPADVRVDCETLGSLYLGAAHVSTLRRAGRVGGADEAVDRFADMADLAVPPYNITGF